MSGFAPKDRPDQTQLLSCMHCGLCLPSCPTYQLSGRERSSPRGRIGLMLAVDDGRLDLDSRTFAAEMDYCLGCLACTSACPAGVDYGGLLERARAQVAQRHPLRGWQAGAARLAFWMFEDTRRLRLVARLLYLYQSTGLAWLIRRSGLLKLLPGNLGRNEPMLGRVPARFSSDRLPVTCPAYGTERAKVGFLTGCVMDVLFARENLATVEVLRHNGCTVIVAPNQTCCGALHAHAGNLEGARRLARQNLAAFYAVGVETVVVNSAGCGNLMKHYGSLLETDCALKVLDVHEFLVQLPWTPPRGRCAQRVTYHDACHLAHGQQIREQPRRLLQELPGLDYRELNQADRCCGSAGVYNLTHFDTSMELLDDKLTQIEASGAEVVGVANPGCLLQIRYGLERRGLAVRAEHPMTLLAEAYASQE